MIDFEAILAFQERFPSKEEKAEALSKMSVEEIDKLVESSPNVYQKVFLASFKNGKKENEKIDGR